MRASAEILRAESPSALAKAKKIVEHGGIIAYPTETFYGLGADPYNEDAVTRLFELKGRGFDKPISILVKDEIMLQQVMAGIPPAAEELIRRFWPGPLTIIFHAPPALPRLLTAGTDKIGVRVSSNPSTQKLLDIIDRPITTTSANPSGKVSPVTAEEIAGYFDDTLDLILDGGQLPGRLGSTVVDVTGDGVLVIRQGEIPTEKILKG
ncbi:MAG: threonylcarbamoyl-AMP synthase [Deltaproteobacteria bacterium]|nr:threonylcarbamoyl-AMP synthase [Deltaproteobacteria bacterium]